MQRLTGPSRFRRARVLRSYVHSRVFEVSFFLLCALWHCDWVYVFTFFVSPLLVSIEALEADLQSRYDVALFVHSQVAVRAPALHFVCEYCRCQNCFLRHPNRRHGKFHQCADQSPADSGRQCADILALCLRTPVVSANHYPSDGSGRGPHYGGS